MMALTRGRVLLIAATSVPGGAEEILAQLAAGLPAEGYQVHVAALRPGPLVERLRHQGTATCVIPSGRVRQPHRVATTVTRLARHIRRNDIDIVWANMATSHLYGGPAAALTGRPAIWPQTDVPDRPTPFDRLATRIPAAAVVALSREATKAQRALPPRRRTVLVHPAVDMTRFAPGRAEGLRTRHGIPTGVPLITIVGRLQPWKGQEQFLHAAAIVHASVPECRFAVVGGAILGWEGDYPERLRALADELGLREVATFTGHTDEVPDWMAASDVVVNASAREPFGLVVIEAMASGCAVIAVDRGGPRDIIEPMQSGLLLPDASPGRMAEAMLRLVREPELRTRLGSAARARATGAFAPERQAAEFARVMTDIIDSRGRG